MENSILNIILTSDFSEAKTEKQKLVIKAALKLFAEKGYANTSTAEIAQNAGVSVGTVFKQYKTKEQILIATMLPMIYEFMPKMTTLTDEEREAELKKIPNFETFIVLLVEERLQIVNQNKEILQVVIKEALYTEELKGLLWPLIAQSVPRVLNNPIEHFKARGEIVDIPTSQIIDFFKTFLAGFMIRYVLFEESELATKQELELLVKQLMNGLKKYTSLT